MKSFTPCKQVSAKTILLIVWSCLLVAGFRSVAHADSFDVNASVPHGAPTVAAVIQPELDGVVARDSLVTVSGTCQALTPTAVVSIWRDGASIGSSSCDGSFSVQVMLVPGVNRLTARTSNISGNYGLDSAPVTIELVLTDQPAASSSGAPTTGDAEPPTAVEKARVTNLAALTGLKIGSTEPFSVLSDSRDAKVDIILVGGTSPYDINLNWGNGATESHVIDVSGTYSYASGYKEAGTYVMRGRVRDAKGAYAEFSYAIVSRVAPAAAAPMPIITNESSILAKAMLAIVIGVAVTGLVGLATFMGFRLGETEIINSLRQRSIRPSGDSGRKLAKRKRK